MQAGNVARGMHGPAGRFPAGSDSGLHLVARLDALDILHLGRSSLFSTALSVLLALSQLSALVVRRLSTAVRSEVPRAI